MVFEIESQLPDSDWTCQIWLQARISFPLKDQHFYVHTCNSEISPHPRSERKLYKFLHDGCNCRLTLTPGIMIWANPPFPRHSDGGAEWTWEDSPQLHEFGNGGTFYLGGIQMEIYWSYDAWFHTRLNSLLGWLSIPWMKDEVQPELKLSWMHRGNVTCLFSDFCPQWEDLQSKLDTELNRLTATGSFTLRFSSTSSSILYTTRIGCHWTSWWLRQK
jgi:hypothetical protein